MLKKKDPKKPFWKRLVKSTEKVKKYYFLFNDYFHFPFFSVNGLLSIGIILQLKVNMLKNKEFFPSFSIIGDDDDELDGAGGKDWGDLGK
jgi:hypothetical protein